MYITEHWQDYQTAIRSNSRPYDKIEGTVTFASKPSLAITTAIMPTNSISISKQCIDGDELMFGGVFANTLKMSLMIPADRQSGINAIDRYDFFNATIDLTYYIQIGTQNNLPVYEEVPLGIFKVADADRPHDTVNLTAYDNMTMLDGSIGANIITGNAWQIFQRISMDTGITLAFEETDLENFPNYELPLEASQDGGINTYRDVAKMVCQLLGCFAYADREGQLALKAFSSTSDLTLGIGDWYSMIPADYQSHYIGLSVTGLAGTYSAGTTDPSEVGSIMLIEDAPAWDFGSQQSLQDRTAELYTWLHALTYTPCDIEMPSDPTFDCGDMLALIPRNGDPNDPTTWIYTIITSMEWKFHNGMSITSEGINPYLSQEAIIDPDSQRILSQAVAKSKLQFVHFTNPSDVNVGDTQTATIAEVEFTPTAETDALFVATILVNATVADITKTTTETVQVPITVKDAQGQPAVITDLQGNPLTVTGSATNTYTYKRDGKCDVKLFYKILVNQTETIMPNEENPYYAVENLENGQHIITIVYPITGLIPWERYGWKICMTVNGGSVAIPLNTVKASIFGQEVNVLSKFYGTITGEDDYPIVVLGKIGMLDMSDSGELSIQTATYASATDNISLYNIDTLEFMQLYEAGGQNVPHIYLQSGFDLLTEEGYQFISEDGRPFITE